MSEQKGLFIVFDGIDGSGKSTQVNLLKERLEGQGFTVIKTREPGGTPGAEEIRNLLVTGEANRWDGISELLLFAAARRNHIETLVKPALAEGKIVICDRFVASTIAYQGYGRQRNLDLIKQVMDIAIEDFTPDWTIFLTIDLEEGLRRATSRAGKELRFESMDLDFYRRVHAGYTAVYEKMIKVGCCTELNTTTYLNETDEECIKRISDWVHLEVDRAFRWQELKAKMKKLKGTSSEG